MRAHVLDIMVSAFMFIIISLIGCTIMIVQYGVANDYLFYNLQELADDLVDGGVVKQNVSDLTYAGFLDFQGLINFLDELWFGIYLLFFIGSIVLSYAASKLSDVTFMVTLFYGVMIAMFILSFYQTFTQWYTTNVLYPLLPNAVGFLPFFDFYLNNIGVITFVHVLLVLFANKINLNFASKKAKEQRELQSIGSEVL